MKRWTLRWACLQLVAAAVFAAHGRADRAGSEPRGYVRQTTALYRRAADPGSTRARALLREAGEALQAAANAFPGAWQDVCERHLALRDPAAGDAMAKDRARAFAVLSQQAQARRARVDDALVKLDAALALQPDDAELLHARARALSLWEQPDGTASCAVRRKDSDAAATLERLREVDPTYRAAQTAFDLGVLRTRTHDFASAALAYARAIELAWDERETAVTYANLAEVTMLAGEPAVAIVHYKRAVALAGNGRDYPLALLGLSAALARLGEHDAALHNATKALEVSGRTLAVLDSGGVFFEPRYEHHYYRALGHEALSRLLPDRRASLLVIARGHYEAFVSAAPPSDPFRRDAQVDLARVERELALLLRATRTLDRLSKHEPANGERPRTHSVTRSGGDAR